MLHAQLLAMRGIVYCDELCSRVALSYCDLGFAAIFAALAQVDCALIGTYRLLRNSALDSRPVHLPSISSLRVQVALAFLEEIICLPATLHCYICSYMCV